MQSDFMHRVTNWIDHNRGQFFGVLVPVAVVSMFLMVAGCSRTQSIADPAKKVDRQEFAIEALDAEQQLEQQTLDIESMLAKHNSKIDAYNLRKEAGIADLDRQDARNRKIVEIAGGAVTEFASGGSVTPLGGLLSLLNIAGIGWGIGTRYDNIRKDKVIENKKTA